jgi:hypothetical protein
MGPVEQRCSITMMWLIQLKLSLMAYGRTRHFHPLHTSLDLQMMNQQEKAAVDEEDLRNKGPHMAVELSFNNIVRKFAHTDYFASHHILQQGMSNWPDLRALWDLQVLGNPCKVILGIAPPTVEEYFILRITIY